MRPRQQQLTHAETLCTGASKYRSDMRVVQSVLASAIPHPFHIFTFTFINIICLPLILNVSVLHPDPRRMTHHGTGGRLPLSTPSPLKRSSNRRRRRRREGNSLAWSLKPSNFFIHWHFVRLRLWHVNIQHLCCRDLL